MKLKYFSLYSIVIPLLILGCVTPPESPSASTVIIDTTNVVAFERILQDNLTNDELCSELNDYNSTEMLSIKPVNDSQFMVTNFVPMDLSDVTITAEFNDISTVIKLITIATIPAHSQTIFSYPTSTGVTNYKGVNDETVVLESENPFKITAVSLDFLVDSPKLQMLRDITVNWNITHHDYYSNSDSATQAQTMWRPIRPAQARLYTLLILNTSYLFSQQEYIDRFLNEPLYKYVDNATRIVEDDQWMTLSEKESIYYDKIANKKFKIGITSGGGLGGGSALGISNGTLTKQFKYKWDDSLETLDYLPESYYTGPHPLYSHEMGHCFGYGHNSNMCSTGRRDTSGTDGWKEMFGFPAVSVLLHSKYVHYELLPCSQDEYYNPIDFEYVQPARDIPYE